MKAAVVDTLSRSGAQVHELRHVMLYADVPDWSTVRFDEMAVIHPNDDALTSSLKSVMRHACRTQQLPSRRCYPNGQQDVDIRKQPAAAAVALQGLRKPVPVKGRP